MRTFVLESKNLSVFIAKENYRLIQQPPRKDFSPDLRRPGGHVPGILEKVNGVIPRAVSAALKGDAESDSIGARRGEHPYHRTTEQFGSHEILGDDLGIGKIVDVQTRMPAAACGGVIQRSVRE